MTESDVDQDVAGLVGHSQDRISGMECSENDEVIYQPIAYIV